MLESTSFYAKYCDNNVNQRRAKRLILSAILDIFAKIDISLHDLSSYELPHDKTNKMVCAPSEDFGLISGLWPFNIF